MLLIHSNIPLCFITVVIGQLHRSSLQIGDMVASTLGLGEKEDDLQIFNAEKFAEAFININ